MSLRRVSLIAVVVAALAACSSGSSTVASSTPSTSPAVASSTSTSSPSESTASPTATTASPTSQETAGGGDAGFCRAFTKLEAARGLTSPVSAGAAFRAAAADMRAHAPGAIRDAAGTYADLMDTIGRAAQSGRINEQGLQKAVQDGMGAKAADIGKVAVWVAKHCNLS